MEKTDILKRAAAALEGLRPGDEWYCVEQNPIMVRSKLAKAEVARSSEVFMDRAERVRRARFIAASRQLVPDMAEEIRRLRKVGFMRPMGDLNSLTKLQLRDLVYRMEQALLNGDQP